MQLPLRVFPDLSEEYRYWQAVKRLCHGCIDKAADQYAVNLNLDSVEMVVDIIKSFS